MALTIKNPETISLAKDLAHRTGMTQTGAVTMALRQVLAETQEQAGIQADRVKAILEHIWANQSPEEANRIKQNSDKLYDERGLPA